MLKHHDILEIQKKGISAKLYADLAAQKIGGTKMNRLSGQPPLTVTSSGNTIYQWGVCGKTVQSASPSPLSPSYAVGVGDRTYNLYNWKDTSNRRNLWHSATIYTYDSTRLLIFIPCVGGETYTIYRFDNVSSQCSMSQCQRIPESGISYAIDGVSTFVNLGFERVYTFTANSSAKYISLSVGLGLSLEQAIKQILPKIMICRSSSTTLPYKPFGYNIPITVNSEVSENIFIDTPLFSGDYIHRTHTGNGILRRKSAMAVFSGSENWYAASEPPSGCYHFRLSRTDLGIARTASVSDVFNSHFSRDYESGGSGLDDEYYNLYVPDTLIADDTAESFKTWLAAQYANGTPVTAVFPSSTTYTDIQLSPIETTEGTTVISADTEVVTDKMYLIYR